MEKLKLLKKEFGKDFNIGLVLAGGGAKGAYQIGVLKALDEYGLLPYIGKIAGSSVGALNSVLFPLGYRKAKEVWDKIGRDSVLEFKSIDKFRGNKKFSEFCKNNNFNEDDLERLIFSRKGFFSRDKLRELLYKNLDQNIVFSSIKSLHIGLVNIPRGYKNITVDDDKNKHTDSDLVDLLIASSALPFVFPSQTYRGREYRDGGTPFVGKNFPAEALSDCDFIIGADMKPNSSSHYDKNKKQCDVYIASDSVFHKGIGSTFNFSKEQYDRLLELGYNDASTVVINRIREESDKIFNEMLLKQEKGLLQTSSEIKSKVVLSKDISSDIDSMYRAFNIKKNTDEVITF